MAFAKSFGFQDRSQPVRPPSRRGFLRQTSTMAAASYLWSACNSPQTATAATPMAAPDFRYCLNTSTINGSKVPIRKQIQIAADAGYDSVEIWIRDVQAFLNEGGSTAELKKELEDLGLLVDSGIAFGNWIVDDDQRRKEGLEQCKRDMSLLAEIGGVRIAAPPSGATNEAGLDLSAAGERYRELLELGKRVGVVPQVELWGFSKNLSTLAEVLYVAAAADHPDACVLLDVYHMYKGGCKFENIDLVPGRRMYCLHMNDYPADPPRSSIKDEHRVYPGDGIAPMSKILQSLAAGGFAGTLSLELFNRDYWQQPAAKVARTGLEKMKQCVASAFNS